MWCVVRFLNEMRPGPPVDSKKFDIAESDNKYGPRPAEMLSFCAKFRIRNSGGGESRLAAPATD
jgi:hypothetical protein